MVWVTLAVLSSFAYAFSNHIDKHLLEKYFKENGRASGSAQDCETGASGPRT